MIDTLVANQSIAQKKKVSRFVVCNGATRIVYSPDKPLSCGAKVWIEALGDVTIIGKDNQLVTI